MSKIKFARMSLMWGKGHLPNEEVEPWLEDVFKAGYDGVACFDRELLRFVEEIPFSDLLQKHDLALGSVDVINDGDFDRLKKICEAMGALGCQHIVALGGLAVRGADMNEIADLFNRMGEVASSYDILACYHNHTGHTGETLEETEELLSLTDPTKFYGFVDVGHATKDFAGHPPHSRATMFLERNWDRIRFIEFKDWSEQYDLATEVGAGEADWDGIFRILKERDYSGWITVEQNGPTGDKTPLESAMASREFIRREMEI